jgi:sterol O-acyltransferase
MTEKHPMRGFFVLFWLSIAFRVVITMYQRWRSVGSPISFDLAFIMTDNVTIFFRAEITMILSLFYAPVYQKLITWRIVPLQLARFIQHGIQATWFLGICAWIMTTNLQWVRCNSLDSKHHVYSAYHRHVDEAALLYLLQY